LPWFLKVEVSWWSLELSEVSGLHIWLLMAVKAIDIILRAPGARLTAIASGKSRISKVPAL